MPVSYLSQPVKSNPYVLPVDLDLMSKVLQYKDQQFNQNQQQIQQGINNFAGLDVMKPEDRQYLNGKVNSLLSNVKGLGNVDLGDSNTASQIESYASSVYNDPKITNAVTGTQMVRKLQQEYDQYKTNPKMKGMFGIANYTKDMTQASQWLSDGQVGTQYQGPTSATPFKDVDKQAASIAKDIKANEYTIDNRDPNNPLYIDRTTGQSKTEQQIQQVVAQRLMQDPDYKNQVQTNAWYLTQGIDPQEIMSRNADLVQNQIDDANKNLDINKQLLSQSSNDPEKTKLYTSRINSLNQDIATLSSNKNDLTKNGLAKYQDNPGAYQTNYYLNNLTSGMAATYAFQKESHELKPDFGTMFKYRYAQADQKMELEAAIHGFAWDIDPTTGQKTLRRLATTQGNYLVDTGNAAPNRVSSLESLEQNATKTSTDIANLESQKRGFLVGSIADAVRADPNLKFLRDTSGKIAGQDALTKLGKVAPGSQGNDYFDINDLNPRYLATATAHHDITPQQAEWYGSLYQAYQDKAEGKPVDVNKFPEGFLDGVDNVMEANNEIQFKKNQLQEANTDLISHIGGTSADASLLTDFQINPMKYYTKQSFSRSQQYQLNPFQPVVNAGQVLDPKVQALQDKINNLPQDQKDAYWDNISRRVQYREFSDVQPLTGKNKSEMPELLAAAHDNGSVIGTKAVDTFKPGDITQVGYHRNEDPATSDQYPFIADVKLTVGSGAKKSEQTEQIGINPTLAQQRGLVVLPKKLQQITDEVMQSQDGSMPRIISNPQTGFSAKIIITKLNNDPNDYRSQARIQVPNAAQSSGYDLPKLGPPLDSPSAAYNFAQNFINNYDKTDFSSFVDDLNKFNATH